VARRFNLLDLNFINCSITTAEEAIEVARRVGGEFLKPEQLEKLSPRSSFSRQYEGTFSGAYYGHKVLHRELAELPSLKDRDPSGTFAFLADPGTGTIALSQSGNEQPQHLDCLARGQLTFGELIYREAHPALGYIDQMGYNSPSDKHVKRRELKYIFWANFWGPAYVEKYGRSFLRGAPGWENQELDDGGILYVATESYFQWWSKPPAEVLSYFQKQIPGIKLYRAKASPEF
jgi:hypothetical protein